MPRKLPPFSAVKAFEAAARHGSFARAAQELDVTSTAVSQHVKSMENWLGETLFHRRTNGVTLTTKAESILPEVTKILDDLAALLPSSSADTELANLTISVPARFADGWLLPRLQRFYRDNSGIAVDLRSGDNPLRLSRQSNVDFTIAEEEATTADMLSDLLLEDAIQPVCTAQYMDLLGLQNPHNWKSVTLIHDALHEGDWRLWADRNAPIDLDWDEGLRYANQWLGLEAARQGRGVFMAHTLAASEMLQDQSLVSLSQAPLATGRRYFLIRRRGHTNPAAIQFRSWLLAAVRAG